MTDEKKPTDLDAGGAEAGGQAPDLSRRKVATALLISPVIMTLGPRPVHAEVDCSQGIVQSLQMGMASYSCTAVQQGENFYELTIERPTLGKYDTCKVATADLPRSCDILGTLK